MKTPVHILALSLLVLISASSFAGNTGNINKETQFNIYPNPVMSGQEVQLELNIDDQKLIHIYVYDFAGKMVMESVNHRLGFGNDMFQENILIDKKGLYLVKIIVEDEATHAKQSKVKKLYVI